MQIKEVKRNKKQYLPLLLLADEQEDMIDRYLESGTLKLRTWRQSRLFKEKDTEKRSLLFSKKNTVDAILFCKLGPATAP